MFRTHGALRFLASFPCAAPRRYAGIKCDVEGVEVEVFRGAQRLLAERRPRILCEIHSEPNREALLVDLKRFGYVWEDGTGR